MAAPPLSTPLPFPSLLPAGPVHPRRCRSAGCRTPLPPAADRRPPSSRALPLALAGLLSLLALLVAPEHPKDQEAICQRHNGVAACRVW